MSLQRFSGVGLSLIVAIGVVLALFEPAGAQQTPAPRQGGTLVMGITADPPHLNSAVTTNIPTQQISSQIHSTLIRTNAKGEVQSELVERWDIGADGKSYTLHLRKNVKWHDGKPFTSQDVKFSLLEVSRKFNGSASSALAPIETIDTPDDHTVVLRLKEPFVAFWPWSLSEAYSQIVPKHIYEGTDPSKAETNFNPIGTGAYKLKEWVKGSHLILERNPDYWKAGQPYLDRLVFKIIPDNAARALALEKGEIDAIPYYALPASAVKQLGQVPGLAAPNSTRPQAGEIIMFYNLRNERLKVKEVRQAIAHAIDRKTILDRALEGLGNPAKSLIPSTQGDFHTDKGRQYEYAPDRANAILDQAGFARGADGTRFGLRISYDRGGEAGALENSAQIIRENLAQVGLRVEIQPMDAAAWQDTSSVKWDFDLTMGSYSTGPDPAIGTSRLYITKNIKPIFAHNLMGYSNPQVDEIFVRAESELDRSKRVALYHQVQEILNEDVPALPLWEKWYPVAFKTDFVGLPPGPTHFESMDAVSWTKVETPAASGGTNLGLGIGALVVLAGAGVLLWQRRSSVRGR